MTAVITFPSRDPAKNLHRHYRLDMAKKASSRGKSGGVSNTGTMNTGGSNVVGGNMTL